LKLAVDKANQLLAKSEKLADDATPEDLEEMKTLAGRLREAIQSQSLEAIQQVTAALDDLVFYLQDV